ncbi:LacI family DNA-binding transcriptional regulator [Oxalobacteraceae bacterium]|nr:LacI family DNA-binding transcriptional regulator [Oxalobacteraceae bacterium]
MTTIRTVAERAGVSTATVSRVMNTPQQVSERTRSRVETAMRELNFSRNSFAASLVTRRSDCIGLIVGGLSGSFFAPLVNIVEETVSAAGSYLIVSCGKDSPADVLAAVQFLRQRQCDAIILFPGQLSDAALQDLLGIHPNVVLIHRSIAGFEERCVQVDNVTGARLAARYLIDCGHRDIGLISGPAANPESAQRLAAFAETLAAAGVVLAPELVFEGDFRLASGRQGMAELLASGRPLSAVFCLSDQMAFGALDYCRAVGIAVPERLSLLGFDDVEYAELVHPKLSTVQQPIALLARTAVEIALRLALSKPSGGPQPLLTPQLMIRDSVRRLA